MHLLTCPALNNNDTRHWASNKTGGGGDRGRLGEPILSKYVDKREMVVYAYLRTNSICDWLLEDRQVGIGKLAQPTWETSSKSSPRSTIEWFRLC